jgi:hypothetical protein
VDDKCVRCRCNGNGRNTFLTSSGSNTGNCTKDENIIRESGTNKLYLLIIWLPQRDELDHNFSLETSSLR